MLETGVYKQIAPVCLCKIKSASELRKIPIGTEQDRQLDACPPISVLAARKVGDRSQSINHVIYIGGGKAPADRKFKLRFPWVR